MKLQTILPALLLFVGGNAVAQNTVSVKGQVLGNTDSCMVALADAENPQNVKRIASAKFKGESFACSAEFKKTPCLVN